MGAVRRGLVLVALAAALLQTQSAWVLEAPEASGGSVAEVVGAGYPKSKAMCLGCAALIVGAAGLTWGGLVVLTFFHADGVLACAYICYGAYGR